MSEAIRNPWPQRDQFLQSLYIPACIQRTLPEELIGDTAIPPELEEFIKEHDCPRLVAMLEPFLRSAATRFFNLPSARSVIERALRAEYCAIAEWLREERVTRFAFDFFGGEDDPLAGYGIVEESPSQLIYTKTVRLVLQRMPSDTYVLWTAYPLLAPRQHCWIDAYDSTAYPPATSLSPQFYYFLNCYLSVTSIYLGADAVIQGTTDFWMYESKEAFQELHESVNALRPNDLLPDDASHLTYELGIRCLNETLPHYYIKRPEVFVEAFQHSLDSMARLHEAPAV